MEPNIKQAIMASFAADALALGVHWVYDTSVIEKKYTRVDSLKAPEIEAYHKGKKKGDFTHYGDQSLVLLQSLARTGKFDLDLFARDWQDLFRDYAGYRDHATRETLSNFSSGNPPASAGSGSSDLAGASRMVPLAAWYHNHSEGFIEACEAQTRMTHNHPLVLASAQLFARIFLEVLANRRPVAGILAALDAMESFPDIARAVEKGIESRTRDTRSAIAGFGQNCAVGAALPSTIHLIARYEDRLADALVENVMAGGDSAARGMLAGFILGAHAGPDAIPQEWLTDMVHGREILKLLG